MLSEVPHVRVLVRFAAPFSRACTFSPSPSVNMLGCYLFFIPLCAQVVSGKYQEEDKFFTLAAHGGRLFAVSEGCGRCQFPLVRPTKVNLCRCHFAVEIPPATSAFSDGGKEARFFPSLGASHVDLPTPCACVMTP